MTLDYFELADLSCPPFDLDFLRAIGVQFGEDWDGELLIECPDEINMTQLRELVESYADGIKGQVRREGRAAQRVCVGGPMNGQPYDEFTHAPMLFHISRGEWAVYGFQPDPEHPGHVSYPAEDLRAWFFGMATSRKKARQVWWNKVKWNCPRV